MNERGTVSIATISLPLANSPLKQVNSYLIQCEGECLLVDVGFDSDEGFEVLVGALRRHDVSIKSIKVFITHNHVDHSGLAGRLAESGANILMNPEEHREMMTAFDGSWKAVKHTTLIEEGFSCKEADKFEDHPQSATASRFTAFDCEPVLDNDIIQIGSSSFQVIKTPGHSPNHCCLFCVDQGILLSGDHVLFDISPNIVFWNGYTDPLAEYLRSLQQVRKLPVSCVLPGHRNASSSLQDRVDNLLRHHDQRLQECLKYLRVEEGSTALEVAAELTWRIGEISWSNLPLSQKVFACGETRAHLEHLVNKGLAIKQLVNGGVYRYALAHPL